MGEISDLPWGIDKSRWQGKMDWEAVARAGVRFMATRASISWGYQDSWFTHSWTEAKRVGILRAAYHVFYPGESVTRQMDHFLKVVGEDLGELPLVLDVELDHGLTYKEIGAAVHAACAYLTNETKRQPMIYSRASWVDAYITGGKSQTPPEWLNQYDWWLAQYLLSGKEHPGPVARPRGVGVDRVMIHQTTDKGAPVGCGAEIKTMDYNRWVGQTPLEQYAFGGASNGESMSEILFDLRNTRDQLCAVERELGDIGDRLMGLARE